MKTNLTSKEILAKGESPVVIPVFEDTPQVSQNELADEFLKKTPKFGKIYQTQFLFTSKAQILLVGIGKKDEVDFERVQNYTGVGVKFFLEKTSDVRISLPVIDTLSSAEIVLAASIGTQIAEHNIASEFKSEKPKVLLKSVTLVAEKINRGDMQQLKAGLSIGESINLARKLGDLPPNVLTPGYFLKVAKKIALQNKLKIYIIDEKSAQRKGLNAFAAVARGSDEPSYIIVIEYRGDPSSKEKYGFVGKGVTFDTGGISIKPASSMHEMKYDMCGAAAVLGVIKTVSELNLQVNLVAVMGITENMPSGKSLKPGDILQSYSGKSAEILNTDAEGRLILIDAVALAIKDYKVTKIVDLATLTGAIIVALGDYYTGLFTNNDEFGQKFIKIGQKVGEKFWQLPMSSDYNCMIQSDFADITNIGHGGSMPGAAGSITGAKFIEAGVKEGIPWVHLDIAGTAWDLSSKPYRGVGATGVGIKTLVELVQS